MSKRLQQIRKVATAKGEVLGIYIVDAVRYTNGVPIKKKVYDDHAQRFVVEPVMQIESNYN